MTEKRKRAAPTIDLKATEVPGPQAAKEAAKEAAKPESAPAQEKPAPSPPPKQERQAPPEPPPPPQSPPAAEAPPPHDFIKTIAMPLAAAFAGALIGGALIWGLSPRAANDGAQIASLRKQIEELQKRPAPPAPAPDTRAVDALRQRVEKIEHDVANLSPGDKTVAERLGAADNAMKSLGIAIAALNKRSDDSAADARQAEARATAAEKAVAELRDSVQNATRQASSAVDASQLAAVQQRVASLDDAVKQAHAQIERSATVDKSARLALSAVALRDAVERGAPYKDELAQAKALGADDGALAPLQTFAASGLPSEQALARELTDLMPALVKAAGVESAPSGFLGRLQANASKLVHVTPVDAPQGDQPADVLARIEVAAARADIEAALSDIGKLPEKARQQAAGWVTRAVARRKALAAVRDLASATARGLAQ